VVASVDEIFMMIAELSISAWPIVDSVGRLRFPEEGTIHLEADAEGMRRFLQKHRQPRRGAGRALRTGDTFGLVVRSRPFAAFLESREAAIDPAMRRMLLDPRTWDWARPPVYDVSADIRVRAKLAYYGALTEPLPEGTTSQ
jgi:hypothetical protein